ncbi:hypothetical protein RN001_006527 [Aquatica leii]|uniref:GILT-like protein 1 n=1 Tax=Aquatica leii TaxID=1421715 RepID=A0AAN7PE68_9COLE|nr:hypothetical protein RN001_006527 [Aquatica leii]
MNSLLLLVALILSSSFQDTHRKLKVSIYYEALCDDSKKFLLDQFYPAYSRIGSNLLVDLVPYGKATHELINGEWEFQCQHGLSECVGNRYQACGLALNKCQDKQIEYINCLMGSVNASSQNTLEKCASKLDVPAVDIMKCSQSRRGDQLLAKYGDQTHKVQPMITFVPTIIFNDSFDSDIQESSLKNFLETACDVLQNKPDGCQKKNFLNTPDETEIDDFLGSVKNDDKGELDHVSEDKERRSN